MPSGALLRDPWSTGDLNDQLDPLQFRRNTYQGFTDADPLLAPGEPAWEIDTATGKVGDGVTRYNSLPYKLGLAPGAAPNIGPQTIVGNNDVIGTAARAGSPLTPTQARGVLDVPVKSTEFTPLANAFAGHAASVAGGGLSHVVSTTITQPGVTTLVALPASVGNGTPISGTGIPDYSFVYNIAVNRLSFQLSSNPLSYIAAPATATGTPTVLLRDTVVSAHGVNWSTMPVVNPLNGKVTGYSSSLALGSTFTQREKWEETWTRGEKWVHSFEFPTPARIFPLQELIASHIIVPVPSAFQVWSPFPTTTAWDFLEPGTAVGRYKLCCPLEGATQARIVVDWMSVGATGGSGAKLKAQYLNTGVWTDLAENSPASPIEVALDTGIGAKVGNWGVIDNAAVALAATTGDNLNLRLVGFAASAAGSPAFATVRLQLK